MQKLNLIDEYYIERDKLIENRYKNLNKNQIKAVLANNLNSCIIACPGSGKTTTLLNRVDYLVNFGQIYKTDLKPNSLDGFILDTIKQYNSENRNVENKVKTKNIEKNRVIEFINNYRIPLANIIVITFTKAAATNMKKRFIKSNTKEVTPFFGTFHALFYKILQREIGRVNIIGKYESYNIIKGMLAGVKEETNDEEIKSIINDISSYKKSSLDIEMYTPHISKDIFIKCFEAYEDYKRKKNLLDFEDLQIDVRDLFLNNRNVLLKYRKLFRYILVDEFQDCDDIQVEILRLLSSEKNSIFTVGDEDQCIYGFRGSKPQYMVNFDKLFFNSKKYFLTINYRCPQKVINGANFLIENNLKRNNKIMDSYKKKNKDNSIQIFSGLDENSEVNYICKEIQKKVNDGEYDYKDYAILYRTNIESRSLVDIFYSKKIPFTLIDKSYNFYDQFICRDLLSYLRLAINPYSKEDFLRIINKPFRYVSGRILTKIRKANINEDLFDYLVDEFEMPNFQIKKIKELKRDIKHFNNKSLQYAINTIVNDLHYYDYLIEYANKMKIPMEELEAVLEEFKLAALKHDNIVSFLTYVNDLGEELKKNDKKNKDSIIDENEVILSTIHGVKGMEFKNVFVINCNEENIPHSNALEENNIEEERRLFYVAITRAKEKLYLGYTNEIRGVSKKVSRFINECNLVEVKNINEFKEGDEINHKYFGEGKIYKIIDGIIKIKFLDDSIKTFKKDIIINNGIMKKR